MNKLITLLALTCLPLTLSAFPHVKSHPHTCHGDYILSKYKVKLLVTKVDGDKFWAGKCEELDTVIAVEFKRDLLDSECLLFVGENPIECSEMSQETDVAYYFYFDKHAVMVLKDSMMAWFIEKVK